MGRKVGVVGSRRFPSRDVFVETLDSFVKPGDVLVSGGARGPDSWAEEYAREHALRTIVFPAKWDDLSARDAVIRVRADGSRYDARAGYRRNQLIVDASSFVIAFVMSDRRGGTEDTIKKAKAAGKRVHAFGAWGKPVRP